MTELQKHLMQLVKEIDETCRDNDLKYALYGRTAGNAMTEDHFTTSCYQFQIMMPAEDMLRLKELLLEKNIPNRGIEDMSVNKNLPHNRMRYVDTGTLVLDKDEPIAYSLPGVAVTIFPLYTKRHSKVMEALEVGMVYYNGGRPFRRNASGYVKKCLLGTKIMLRVKGKDWIMEQLYHMIEQEKGRTPGEVYYEKTGADRVRTIPVTSVTETERIPFEGMMLPVAADRETYLRDHFGPDWETLMLEQLPNTGRMEVIWDAHIFCLDFVQELKEENIDIYDIFHQAREYRQWLINVYKGWRAKYYQTLRFGKRSVDRIDLFIHYKPLMAELREAARKEDVEALREMLEPYLECVDKYKKKKMGFYITKELHALASLVWEADEMENYANEVYVLTPERYRTMDMEKYLAEYR